MKTINDTIQSWNEKLNDFERKANGELADIRQCKQEIQSIKEDLYNDCTAISDHIPANYIRDERRIILSAPEIIIGNVDSQGVLMGGGSVVVLRGNTVNVEGCGNSEISQGRINMRAASIRQIAEDPGIDGREGVVVGTSEIISQARGVSIISEDAQGLFTQSPIAGQGVSILSENHISIGALRSNKAKSENIDALKKIEKNRISQLKEEAKKHANSVKGQLSDLKKLMEYDEDMAAGLLETRTNYMDIDELYDNFGSLSTSLYQSMSTYFAVLSQLAEANRREKALDKMSQQLSKEKSNFKTKSTGTHISLTSESISALSMDGDGNYRENEGAGVSVNARTVQVTSMQADGSLHKDGGIKLAAQNIDITTANPKHTDKKTTYPAFGNVKVVSKNMTFEAVDYETEKDKTQETALTKDGKIMFRAQGMSLLATQTDGKGTGSINLNAKRVEVKSMDVDKEKRTDKDLTEGGAVKVVAQEVHMGAVDKKKHSKKLQLVSEKIVALADSTLEMQQDGGKALVQLDGGSFAATGSKVDLYGKTTMQGATTFKDKVTSGDIEVKNLNVKTSFKSSNISDGIAIPGAPATGKLSAKLKEEELKAQASN